MTGLVHSVLLKLVLETSLVGSFGLVLETSVNRVLPVLNQLLRVERNTNGSEDWILVGLFLLHEEFGKYLLRAEGVSDGGRRSRLSKTSPVCTSKR